MNIIETINKLDELCDSIWKGKSATQEQIRQAEEALGLSFAPEYKEYLTQFGHVSATGIELTGIGWKNIDVVELTQSARNCDMFPDNLYVVEDPKIDGIVIVQSATGEIYRTCPGNIPEKIFDSFAEYIEKAYIEAEGYLIDDDDDDYDDDDDDD